MSTSVHERQRAGPPRASARRRRACRSRPRPSHKRCPPSTSARPKTGEAVEEHEATVPRRAPARPPAIRCARTRATVFAPRLRAAAEPRGAHLRECLGPGPHHEAEVEEQVCRRAAATACPAGRAWPPSQPRGPGQRQHAECRHQRRHDEGQHQEPQHERAAAELEARQHPGDRQAEREREHAGQGPPAAATRPGASASSRPWPQRGQRRRQPQPPSARSRSSGRHQHQGEKGQRRERERVRHGRPHRGAATPPPAGRRAAACRLLEHHAGPSADPA